MDLLASKKLCIDVIQFDHGFFNRNATGNRGFCCFDRDYGSTRFAGGDHAIAVHDGNTLFVAAVDRTGAVGYRCLK